MLFDFSKNSELSFDYKEFYGHKMRKHFEKVNYGEIYKRSYTITCFMKEYLNTIEF